MLNLETGQIMGTMLEYAKTVLSNVSFDVSLFQKELSKVVTLLVPDEVNSLINWIQQEFSEQEPLLDAISNL